jgi:putative flippase GtrA
MSIIKQFTGKDHGPLVQFIKYGIAGGIATAVHITCFSLMAWLVLPALSSREIVVKLFDLPVPEISDAVRAQRAAIDNLVAFLISNMSAYLINIFWVFHRGRHHWVVEILMFYAVSGVSMIIGTGIQTWLIASFSFTTEIAFVANIMVALLINFAMRKFVIFKG